MSVNVSNMRAEDIHVEMNTCSQEEWITVGVFTVVIMMFLETQVGSSNPLRTILKIIYIQYTVYICIYTVYI